jgi:CubicO group peptidase (beta-lactamase class C family)
MHQPPPSLQKLSEEQKKIIKENQNPDASIIAEYSALGCEISSEIIAKIRGNTAPFVTSPTNIGNLSQSDAGIDLSKFVPDGQNINLHALVAVVTNEKGTVKSSLITGTTTPDPASGSIDKDTTIAVGSVTKMFTSAALLKLWDEELTATKKAKIANQSEELTEQPKNFPQGIDTPLSHFMDGLKEKFPDCTYLKTIEKAEHYPQVTLRDLLNHTHALGSRDEEKIAVAQMENPSKRFSCSELVEFSKQDPKDKFGEFKYSNLGTELAGMVIELVTDKKYEEALKDLVLDPVGAKNTGIKGTEEAEKNTSSGYCFITPFLHGEKEYSGEMNLNNAGNSMAAGGIKTTAEDGDKFIRKFLSETAGETSLFQNREVVEALFRDKDNEGKHNICGVNKYTVEKGNVFYGHNGDNGLSEASLKFNPKTGESFFYAAVGETLSFAVAYETLKKSGIEKPELGEILSRRDELKEVGFDFSKMKSMVDEKKPFAEIAEGANIALERAKSEKSSEEVVPSERSPSSSPRAPKPPLRASPTPPSPRR